MVILCFLFNMLNNLDVDSTNSYQICNQDFFSCMINIRYNLCFFFQDDTVRVIYSYHPSDPTSPTSLPWHGASRRGTKSLMLLSGPGDVHIDLPADTKTFEFRNNNVSTFCTASFSKSTFCPY